MASGRWPQRSAHRSAQLPARRDAVGAPRAPWRRLVIAMREQVELLSARDVVSAVPDPEMPYITLGDLGVVGAVRVNEDARSVHVELTPTYLGCPATEVIQQDVKAALLDAGWR